MLEFHNIRREMSSVMFINFRNPFNSSPIYFKISDSNYIQIGISNPSWNSNANYTPNAGKETFKQFHSNLAWKGIQLIFMFQLSSQTNEAIDGKRKKRN